MKKLMAVLCALLLTCFAVSALADNIAVRANTSETLKALIGGKTVEASITGLEVTGEDEDAKFTVLITVCERDEFDPAAIDNLAEYDVIYFGNGTSTAVSELVPKEDGVIVKGFSDEYSFSKNDAGNYTVTTDADYPIYSEIYTVKVQLEKDVVFQDWSDPENLEAPVQLGFEELIGKLQEGTLFAPFNTKVTFDENGKLVEILYNYSPWN